MRLLEMHNLVKPFFTLFLFLTFLTVRAQQIQRIGVPYVQSYAKSAYKAGNQNWSIVKDSRGVMYFGNYEGLLAFDGNNWQLFQAPNQLIIRAVAADQQGKVYTGGFGEFGYWDYDAAGKFTYTSLVELVAEDVVAKDEIWKIYVDGERVIFQSFACIYIFENGKIYLGTNQGIYYSDWSYSSNSLFQSFNFRLIPNSQGQVWDLSLIDGQLLCGHNAGTFRVRDTGIQKISAVNGGWTIKRLPSNPEYLIQGTYTGLVLYKRDKAGNWVFSHRVEGYGEPSRYVEQDNTGHIWVSHAYRGLYRLKLSEDLTTVVDTRNYDMEQGLPDNFNVNIFRLNNRIVFSSQKGFYIYDDLIDRFSPYAQLNEKLGTFASSNKIINATEGKYWLINQGRVALAEMPAPGEFRLNANQFSILSGRMVQYYENISHISDSLYLISIDDGFVIYNTKIQLQRRKEAVPVVLIRRVENITDGITTISEHNTSLERRVEIPYRENNIRFSYALPYYSQASIRFQYFLKGYSTKWSEWSSEVQKEFTNLDYGKYSFLVRASINEADVSEITAFEFTVLPPWYATNLAFLLYFVLAIGAVFLFRHLYQIRLQREKEQIQQKLEQEKEEYLRQQQIETEQRLVKLKNEQLQTDLASKSRELSNSALSIVAKNELLQTIKAEVAQLHELTGKSLPKDQYKKIQKIIVGGMSDEQDWHLFERSFNEAHENYFKKLKADHPELTPNDLKLCAYLRMSMNSKEIASLLNITVRGVELRRYRLRKRLNLEHDKNLTEYLLEV